MSDSGGFIDLVVILYRVRADPWRARAGDRLMEYHVDI